VRTFLELSQNFCDCDTFCENFLSGNCFRHSDRKQH
jgi:hypothetical protein